MRDPKEPKSETTPLYFGNKDRPLFGCLHSPIGNWSGTRVVICAPLGYEGQFAFLALRELATHLAEAYSAVVLRFDYDGCGDSTGTDEDPDRVTSWIASINCAIDKLKIVAASNSPIVLIGLRAGALLAAMAAASRKDIHGLVLWAPCSNGRLFLREQRSFSSLARVTATADGGTRQHWGTHGFEANGYVFTEETVLALEKLDLKSISTAPTAKLLVVDRADLPSKRVVPDSWKTSDVNVKQEVVAGYTEMLQPPWLSTLPIQMFSIIGGWLGSLTTLATPRTMMPAVSIETAAIIAPGIAESAVWYDPQQSRFGILTVPDNASTSHALILITSTFGYRIGPNRMNVTAARSMAPDGVAVLRIDLAGVGESKFPSGKKPNGPYALEAVEDVRLAIAFLQSRGYQHIALAGICAAAYMAWQAAVVLGSVSRVLLVNPQTFLPIKYSLDDEKNAMQGLQTWTARFQKEPHLFGKIKILWNRFSRIATVFSQQLRARLPMSIGRPYLALKVDQLGKQTIHTSIIFSNNDHGIKEFYRQLGPKARRFERMSYLTTVFIDGPDHSFTPRWASRMLMDAFAHDMKAWFVHTEQGWGPGRERPR